MDWYYTAGNEQRGPVSEPDLQQLARDGVIDGRTLVWRAGLAAWEPAVRLPALAGLIPVSVPPIPQATEHRPAAGGAMAAIVPYRNVPALAGYYLGVFGLIPTLFIVGGFFGIIPLLLGIIGLRRARANPEAKGKVHAWVAISLGTLEVLVPIVGFALALAFRDRNG